MKLTSVIFTCLVLSVLEGKSVSAESTRETQSIPKKYRDELAHVALTQDPHEINCLAQKLKTEGCNPSVENLEELAKKKGFSLVAEGNKNCPLFIGGGGTLTLSCDDDKVINVTSTFYGNKKQGCQGNPENSIELQEMCNHRPLCNIKAAPSVFFDSCPGVHKYLMVAHKCLSAKEAPPRKTRKPQHAWSWLNSGIDDAYLFLDDAVKVGKGRDETKGDFEVFVARTQLHRRWIPGKLVFYKNVHLSKAERFVTFFPWNGTKEPKSTFQILVDPDKKLQFIRASPDLSEKVLRAIGGSILDGEETYIGRATRNKSVLCGEIEPKQQILLAADQDQTVQVSIKTNLEIEILCSRRAVEWINFSVYNYSNYLPPVMAGVEPDSSQGPDFRYSVLVARTQTKGETVIGKILEPPQESKNHSVRAIFTVNGKDTQMEHFQLLVDNDRKLKWTRASPDLKERERAFVGGKTKNGADLFVGRTKHECKNDVIGTIYPNSTKLSYGWRNEEFKVEDFDILVYRGGTTHAKPGDLTRAYEDEIMKLSCADGTININTAFYGNKEEGCRGSPTALSIMEKLCDGKKSCSLEVSRHVFDDPCPSGDKYLEVYYECVPGSLEKHPWKWVDSSLQTYRRTDGGVVAGEHGEFEVFVMRVFYNSEILVGKFGWSYSALSGYAYVAVCGIQLPVDSFQLLTDPRGVLTFPRRNWITGEVDSTSDDAEAVVGGRDKDRFPLFIGRTKDPSDNNNRYRFRSSATDKNSSSPADRGSQMFPSVGYVSMFGSLSHPCNVTKKTFEFELLRVRNTSVVVQSGDYTKAEEGDTVSLQCNPGDRIYIHNAFYGNIGHVADCKRSFPALQIAERMCENQNNCSIQVSKDIFGQVCDWSRHTFSLVYDCIKDHRDEKQPWKWVNSTIEAPPLNPTTAAVLAGGGWDSETYVGRHLFNGEYIPGQFSLSVKYSPPGVSAFVVNETIQRPQSFQLLADPEKRLKWVRAFPFLDMNSKTTTTTFVGGTDKMGGNWLIGKTFHMNQAVVGQVTNTNANLDGDMATLHYAYKNETLILISSAI